MCVNNQSLVRELAHAIYIYIYIYIYRYIYIYVFTRFQKRCNLKKKMKCVHLLFSHQMVSLFDEKTKGIYIFHVYFPLQRFWKGVCIYIYHINYGVIQGFPALRKAVTTHVKKDPFFHVCLISPISCWHVTRLSRHSVRLMNERQNLHYSRSKVVCQNLFG